MALPQSFLKSGFLPPKQAANGGRKFKRLMIGLEGEESTGKTEFALSAPGPTLMIALDRNFDGTLDNPHPPPSRISDFAIKVVQAPGFTQTTKDIYMNHWREFYKVWEEALINPDARTVILDGDSDSWELQRLAEFGTLTNVPGRPGIAYTGVQHARRIMYKKAWDSGRIIIATNKLKPSWTDMLDGDGKPVLEPNGERKRTKSGELERQGFEDQNYLWHIQLRTLRKDPHYNTVTKRTSPLQFGVKILSVKANMELAGEELWGSDCNFRTLVEYVYPQIPVAEWGF